MTAIYPSDYPDDWIYTLALFQSEWALQEAKRRLEQLYLNDNFRHLIDIPWFSRFAARAVQYTSIEFRESVIYELENSKFINDISHHTAKELLRLYISFSI